MTASGSEQRLLAVGLGVRIAIALCTRTFFQPDEHCQALEPAYRIVFGSGALTWEWHGPAPVRSILYPALNVPVYWLVKLLLGAPRDGASSWRDIALIAGPRILHGALASLADIGLCRLTRNVLGMRYVHTALLVSLTSMFHALALSRSLSNSLETSLTVMALSFYPSDHRATSGLRKMLVFAALACAMRPTSLVIWVYIGISLLCQRRNVKSILLNTISIAALTALFILILDSLYYGKLTFTPLNFLLTNLSSVSSFYGTNAWHFYLTQGIPILCTTCLPFALHGAFLGSSLPRCRVLVGAVPWTVGVYSLARHKEWRFIHPLLPIMHMFAAKSLVDLASSSSSSSLVSHSLPIRKSHLAILVSTVPISLYVVLFYCSGPISVMGYLRSLPPGTLSTGGVGFLMPCHSTPWQTHLHRPDAEQSMWALGCEPPLGITDITSYQDQTDVFFSDPSSYLLSRFPAEVDATFPPSPKPRTPPGTLSRHDWEHEWPRYLVLFGALLHHDGVRDVLEERGYAEVWKAGREWEGEGERRGGVRVWKWAG